MTIMGTVISLLIFLINLYVLVLTLRAVLDLIPLFAPSWRPSGIILVVANAIYALTDPPLNLLRKYIPPLRIGGVAFDIGFLVLFFGLVIVRRFLFSLYYVL